MEVVGTHYTNRGEKFRPTIDFEWIEKMLDDYEALDPKTKALVINPMDLEEVQYVLEPLDHLGSYARAHLKYLFHNYRALLDDINLYDDLIAYLNRVEHNARERKACLERQMMEREGFNEEMLREDPWKWSKIMSNIQTVADESVQNDIVFAL